MKILVVQLLRLGDVILSSPVIAGLRDQYPHAQIDILVNKDCVGALDILPTVDHCFTFDRNLIQTSLGERERFVFEAYDRVEELLQRLNAQNYDRIINLTQNKLSAYLVGGIQCQDRVGLWVDEKNQKLIETNWFRHLNIDNKLDSSEHFHFVDIFKFAAGINRSRLRVTLRETRASFAHEYRADLKCEQHIVVQALTSDAKKNWGLENFKSCIKQIRLFMPNSFFTVLAAPSEQVILEAAFGGISYCKVLVCDLATAYSLMKSADLMLTGDTSIKHIASATETPIIEISIGSSEFRRTGTYSNNAVIIQTNERCSPCVHSRACHEQTHACAINISPEIVSLAAIDILRQGLSRIGDIAAKFRARVTFYRVDIQTTGIWNALKLDRDVSEKQIKDIFNKFATKLYLQSKEENIFDIFGSESQKLTSLLRESFRGARLDQIFTDLEKEFFSLEAEISSDENQFYQNRFQSSLANGESIFVRMRQRQLQIEDIKAKTDIRLKLSRSLLKGVTIESK